MRSNNYKLNKNYILCNNINKSINEIHKLFLLGASTNLYYHCDIKHIDLK